MQFHIITVFPEMFTALNVGITGRAQKSGLISIHTINPRNFANDPGGRIDDRPYGGGPGMVMQYQPLHDAIIATKKQAPATHTTSVIYLSPQGTPLKQSHLNQMASQTNQTFILLAGRYEGIDERLIQTDVDQEYSVGDYVLTGGELPAMTLIDGLTRLLPNALGDAQSAVQDSFQNGLLDHPHYTRPAIVDEMPIPNVLQSGDHKAITDYRLKESLRKTWQKRPDLLKRRIQSEHEAALLDEIIKEQHK